MAASLYDISVRSYLQSLDALCGVLDKASAYCAEVDMAPDDLLSDRLADDMLPLTCQLHMATTHSLGTIAGIREGLFAPPRGIPELDYAGFRQRVEDAATELRAMEASDINAMSEKPVTFRISDMEIPFTAEGFVLSFSLPNLYFHTTTTYAILRAAGVPLGKRDFLGQMQVAG